jgi:hypothetical protein
MSMLRRALCRGNVRELENTIEPPSAPEPVIQPRDIVIYSAATPGPTGLPSLMLKQNLEWTERRNGPAGARSRALDQERRGRDDGNQPACAELLPREASNRDARRPTSRPSGPKDRAP